MLLFASSWAVCSYLIFSFVLLVSFLATTINALITLQTIRDLTNTTDECRARIEQGGKVWGAGLGVGVREEVGQVVLVDGGRMVVDGERVDEEKGEETEIVSLWVSFRFLVLRGSVWAEEDSWEGWWKGGRMSLGRGEGKGGVACGERREMRER